MINTMRLHYEELPLNQKQKCFDNWIQQIKTIGFWIQPLVLCSQKTGYETGSRTRTIFQMLGLYNKNGYGDHYYFQKLHASMYRALAEANVQCSLFSQVIASLSLMFAVRLQKDQCYNCMKILYVTNIWLWQNVPLLPCIVQNKID